MDHGEKTSTEESTAHANEDEAQAEVREARRSVLVHCAAVSVAVRDYSFDVGKPCCRIGFAGAAETATAHASAADRFEEFKLWSQVSLDERSESHRPSKTPPRVSH